MMKKIIFLFSIYFINLTLEAQNLPKGLTEVEKQHLNSYYTNDSKIGNGFFYPPISKVRCAAEWEEIDALLVTWTSYQPVLKEIVRAAVEECKVIIVCTDSNSVKNYLTSGGVSLTNVKYLVAPFNSVWARDYSANSVYTNEVDSLLLVDWTYNRPRAKDDTLARSVSKFLNLPLYEMSQAPYKLVATGGNFMSDGMGNAFSSNLIIDENALGGLFNQNLTESDIDTLTKKFLGIKRYTKFTNLPYDDIHHIDMHMKLLNEETILVGEYPADSADGPQIEANIQYLLSNYNSVFGTPYKIVRIPMPPDNYNNRYPPDGYYLTFTNGVFVNKTFIYPTYYAKYDTVAQRIYEQQLPGYNVVGVNCSSTISASGAIHCITHSIASNDPLLIVHKPSEGNISYNPSPYINITAYIKHKSGIEKAYVVYKYFGIKDSVEMIPMGGQPDYYIGNIPLPMSTKYMIEVDYYITAKSNSGKIQNRPITAPNGFWSFVADVPGNIESFSDLNQIIVKDIYPNPASAITCISVYQNKYQFLKIELFDILGQKVYNIYEGEANAGNKNYFFDASMFKSGLYFVKFSSNNFSTTKKIIVK